MRFYNSRTRNREEFIPIDPENIRLYVCGPTVYDRAHLGNARAVVVFDVLYRLLRHHYDHVTYVRNFTDVDDKINAAAFAQQKAGDTRPLEVLIKERTETTISWFHEDMDALGALRPVKEPRATKFITQMIEMIETLVERGHAYHDGAGSVLFSVHSFKSYGALSGRSVDEMIAGARVEVAQNKRDPMDFVLWKPSDDELPGWDSPWGRGRPGWHIECSAMSYELLGAQFDIHGGGLDLQFPHHENEIAQSCCALDVSVMANFWMHNEMLQVEGKKMSKSLGNFFTVRDLLDQNIPGLVMRHVLLSTHYRKPINWTEERVKQAYDELKSWSEIAKQKEADLNQAGGVIEALADDLNTPLAFHHLRDYAKEKNSSALRAGLELLGFSGHGGADCLDEAYWARGEADTEQAHALATVWSGFRKAKHFENADELRQKAAEIGIELRATPEGAQAEITGAASASEIEALLTWAKERASNG